MDPSIYLSLHNEVKDSFRDYDFINTDGSVSDNKAAAAAVNYDYSSIGRLPDPEGALRYRRGLRRRYIFCRRRDLF